MKKYEKNITDWTKVPFTKYVIIVPTEQDKQELMEAFEHIHYSDIDTDYIAVNQLAHEYLDLSEDVVNNIIVDLEAYENHNTEINKRRKILKQSNSQVNPNYYGKIEISGSKPSPVPLTGEEVMVGKTGYVYVDWEIINKKPLENED